MQTIGDRLAEARKRLGIALREASEATKIRTDYLQAMENGTFDFSLPEVYKSGFLKIYATFLKLDAQKLAEDYATLGGGNARGERENLGRVEAPGGLGSAGAAPRARDADGHYDNTGRDQNQAAIIRLVVVMTVVIVVIVLLAAGLKHLLNSSTTPEESTKTAGTTPPAAQTPPPTPQPAPLPAPSQNNFIFSATSDITSLVVTDDATHKVLFSGALKKGRPLPLSAKNSVLINVSQTQYLSIQVNSGSAQSIADANHNLIKGPLLFHWPVGGP